MKILIACSLAERARAYLTALEGVGVARGDMELLEAREAARPGLETLAERADALLLTGGADVEPWRYGEQPRFGVEYDHFGGRDELEWRLLEGARRSGTPVFGICRGFQMINVFLGGTLWHDLPLERGEQLAHRVREPLDALAHDVDLLGPEESPLREELARFGPRISVNSRHHQGVRDLAPTLRAVATAADGLIEAFESSDPAWWVRAVQWHPENLQAHSCHRWLFQSFVAQAATRQKALVAVGRS